MKPDLLDKFDAMEAGLRLVKRLNRTDPDVFVYTGYEDVLPLYINIHSDKYIEVPERWNKYEVNYFCGELEYGNNDTETDKIEESSP